jgi:hypothetical protein
MALKRMQLKYNNSEPRLCLWLLSPFTQFQVTLKYSLSVTVYARFSADVVICDHHVLKGSVWTVFRFDR